MLPTQLVNVQNFKPASTSKIALLLPLNGQARSLAVPFSKALKRRKTVSRRSGSAVPAQVAQAASTDVVSPSQAEVTDLTSPQTQAPVQAPASAAPVQAATSAQPETTPPATSAPAPVAQPQAVASVAANPSAELKIYDTSLSR
jgi:outer membrane PBP1 activator LpoA protein